MFNEELGSLKVLITLDTTTSHVPHDHVPAESDRVLVWSSGVVGGEAVLEESLGVGVCVTLVRGAENHQSNLKLWTQVI